ncbi:MAG: hypothetical protein H7222_08160 [Methylotenera sp.]|nr:hypothetical protein [Oligoflexia bacterium]
MIKEFKKAQATELKNFEKSQKSELRDLKSSQTAHQKEWEAKEKETRHVFFQANPGGPERRSYVKDFLDRRKVMVNVLKDEQVRRSQEQEVKKRALIEDQRGKLKEFEEALAKGEHPNNSLWPR